MNQTTSCQRELGEEKLSARVTFVFLLSRALQRTPLRRACRRLGRQTAPAVDRDRVAAAVVDAVAKQSAQAGVAHLLRAVGHGGMRSSTGPAEGEDVPSGRSGDTSAQTCLHDWAADRRTRRRPLARASASVSPRRVRPHTRHRSLGNGTLLALVPFVSMVRASLQLLDGAGSYEAA